MNALPQAGEGIVEGGEIAAISEAIKLAGALTEGKFLDIGESLGASADILVRLAATFHGLIAELESEEIKQATRDITQAAGEVSALSGAYRGAREILGQIGEVLNAIDGRITRMHKAVKSVEVLGVSAKIEAVHLGDGGTEFLSFANQIDRSLKLAQVNLARLVGELSGVRGPLEQASGGEREFDKRHAEALRLIPTRLAASVQSIAAHREQAVEATSAVAERSQQIGRRIGDAVMALQIGDITRQRIEHVGQAVGLLQRIALSEGELDAAEADDWHLLTRTERQRLVALGCRIQSAQLSDAARELDQEVRRIFTSLEELAGRACEIVRLGEQAHGGSGGGQSTFLVELEEDVGRAHALLDGFRAARTDADQIVESVRSAATRLVDDIGTIRALETDIRIMSLNTTLKCGRLGGAGRPLGVIAQELRICANLTAVEADSVIASLERMTDCVAALSSQDQKRRASDIAAVAEMITSSANRLGAVGHGLTDALATLKRDSDAVNLLLKSTAERITVHEEIGAVLRRAAASLARLAQEIACATNDTSPDDNVTEAGERMLGLFAASYTMAQEREIHAKALGSTSAALDIKSSSLREAARPEAVLDDILF